MSETGFGITRLLHVGLLQHLAAALTGRSAGT